MPAPTALSIATIALVLDSSQTNLSTTSMLPLAALSDRDVYKRQARSPTSTTRTSTWARLAASATWAVSYTHLAVEQKCELIVAHHPVIFAPLKQLGPEDMPFRLVQAGVLSLIHI